MRLEVSVLSVSPRAHVDGPLGVELPGLLCPAYPPDLHAELLQGVTQLAEGRLPRARDDVVDVEDLLSLRRESDSDECVKYCVTDLVFGSSLSLLSPPSPSCP